jgi:hypothetical protein
MTPSTISPAVSGKLMARGMDVVDAEFEVIPAALVPARPAPATRPTHASRPPVSGMATLGASPVAPPGNRHAGPAFWIGGIMIAFAAFWISGGYAAFIGPAIAPTTAFALNEVTSRVDLSGNRPIILVDGKAANDGSTAAVLPDLEIRVTDLAGGVTRYRLGTSSPTLEPGERFAFSSRLDGPKDGVKSVAVSFSE